MNFPTVFLFLTHICAPTRKPTPAIDDVCVFYCPAKIGFPINQKLYKDNVGYSLHGFWYKTLEKPIYPIDYNTFINMFTNTSFNYTFSHIFYDVTTLTKTIGCGQYHQYLKHGAKSGYYFDSWIKEINNCPIPNFAHQCRFNGTHNIAITQSTVNIGKVGCKVGYPIVSHCKF